VTAKIIVIGASRLAIAASGLARLGAVLLVEDEANTAQVQQLISNLGEPRTIESALANPKLPFAVDGESGKRKAQWKQETYGRKLK